MATDLQGLVASIVASTAGLPDPAVLATWSPPISGDIDIHIQADGSWLHEGTPIQREGLVRLFASLLRKEADAEYYLVTPQEKWRITVARHPLVVIDCNLERDPESAPGTWYALLNTGGRCPVASPYRLHPAQEPYIDLPNGLTAQLTRAAWYRLVQAADIQGDRAFILSAGERIELGATS